MPPYTTIRRITTNFKTKNNHNCQKIQLYGSPTTKDFEKKYSPTGVGEAKLGSWGRGKVVVAGRTGGPTFLNGR